MPILKKINAQASSTDEDDEERKRPCHFCAKYWSKEKKPCRGCAWLLSQIKKGDK